MENQLQTRRPSSKHLTHRYPAYFGCTLIELVSIVLINMVAVIFVSLLLSIWIGHFALCLLGIFVVSLFSIKQSAKWYGNQKANKPAGFTVMKFRLFLHEKLGLSLPYIMRTGLWLTRRTLK